MEDSDEEADKGRTLGQACERQICADYTWSWETVLDYDNFQVKTPAVETEGTGVPSGFDCGLAAHGFVSFCGRGDCSVVDSVRGYNVSQTEYQPVSFVTDSQRRLERACGSRTESASTAHLVLSGFPMDVKSQDLFHLFKVLVLFSWWVSTSRSSLEPQREP